MTADVLGLNCCKEECGRACAGHPLPSCAWARFAQVNTVKGVARGNEITAAPVFSVAESPFPFITWAGLAYGEDGVARGAMGTDAADYDRSGWPHLLVGNYSKQMMAIYHNDGTGRHGDTRRCSNAEFDESYFRRFFL
jgi:hypothetical protein